MNNGEAIGTEYVRCRMTTYVVRKFIPVLSLQVFHSIMTIVWNFHNKYDNKKKKKKR